MLCFIEAFPNLLIWSCSIIVSKRPIIYFWSFWYCSINRNSFTLLFKVDSFLSVSSLCREISGFSSFLTFTLEFIEPFLFIVIFFFADFYCAFYPFYPDPYRWLVKLKSIYEFLSQLDCESLRVKTFLNLFYSVWLLGIFFWF